MTYYVFVGVLATYSEVRRSYREQKEADPQRDVDPNATAEQLRIDISPTGIAVATLSEKSFRFINFHEAGSYEQAVSRAAHEITSNPFLKANGAAVLTFWPEEIRHETMTYGPDGRFPSAEKLDSTVKTAPDELQLDPAYAYRTLPRDDFASADCIGIKLTGWQAVQNALPQKALLGRYWGPLAALEIISKHFQEALPKSIAVLGIADSAQIYYFRLKEGNFAGMRVAPRQSIQDCSNLQEVLQTFEISNHPEIYMVDLARDSADMDEFCLAASQENIAMYLLTRENLMDSFKPLASAASYLFFPIALLWNCDSGGSHVH